MWENIWSLPISFYPFLLLEKLGIPFNITYADIKKLSHLPLPKINLNIPIDTKKYTLILHSGGTFKFIQWPEHHYLSLCDLLNKLPVQIILTGTQEEINTYPNLDELKTQFQILINNIDNLSAINKNLDMILVVKKE